MKQKIEKGFQRQNFMTMMGAYLGNLALGKCEIILPFKSDLTQQHGMFHGGVVATIADNAAGFAAYSLMTEGYQPLTIEFKVSFLSPSKGQNLIARADILKATKSIFYARSDVFISEDFGKEEHVAIALVTVKSSKSVAEI